MAKIEIPIRVYMGEIEEIINELKHLQTYKLFEGDDEVLINRDGVIKIFANHLRTETLSGSTIEPERKKEKWIPCNTQEPDGIGCYLLYRPHFWRGNNGQITVCYWNGHRWSDNYTDDESRALPEVRGMAWMPLPDPWRGEEDE